MFGLSWGQIAIIVLVGVFVLGPERIPTAVTWVLTSLRKVRTMAAGAQAELRREIGPEIDELRRQVADLQSLKEIQELRDLRDLHPKRLIGKNILGDEFSGGITGFLGLTEQPVKPSAPGPGGVSNVGPVATDGPAAKSAAQANGASQPGAPAAVPPMQSGNRPVGPNPTGPSPTAPSAVRPAPSMTKLAAPKVVGQFTPRAPRPEPAKADRPPFDPDGT
jgi:sec-independent protein translocase protein TatB